MYLGRVLNEMIKLLRERNRESDTSILQKYHDRLCATIAIRRAQHMSYPCALLRYFSYDKNIIFIILFVRTLVLRLRLKHILIAEDYLDKPWTFGVAKNTCGASCERRRRLGSEAS